MIMELKRPVYVLLPMTSGGYLMQEECCWGSNSHATPSLALHVAAEYLRQGRAVRFLPVDPARLPPELDGACDAAMIFTWALAPALHNLIGAIRHRVGSLALIANPERSYKALNESDMVRRLRAEGTPLQVSAGVFRTQAPLPLHLLRDRIVFPSFSRVLYQVSTGCPYRCPYCVWASPFEVRDAALCAREISQLYDTYCHGLSLGDGEEVQVLTNAITGRSDWLATFCAGLPAGMTWISDVNVRDATLEDLELAARSGLTRVCLGIEFLTDAMLKKLNKGHTVERAFQVMVQLEMLGIGYRFSLRSGVGETPADLKELLVNLKAMADAKPGPLRPGSVYCGPMVEWPGYPWLTRRYDASELVNLNTEKYPRLALRLSDEVKAGWRDVIAFCKAQGWAY